MKPKTNEWSPYLKIYKAYQCLENARYSTIKIPVINDFEDDCELKTELGTTDPNQAQTSGSTLYLRLSRNDMLYLKSNISEVVQQRTELIALYKRIKRFLEIK